jgi:cell division protein FtsX
VLIFVPVYNYIKEGIEAVLPFISMISISDMALYLLGGIGAFGLVVTIIASVFSLKFYLKMYGD